MSIDKTAAIQGEKVILRQATMDDLDDYYQLLCDPESARLTGTQAEFSREDAEKWLSKISGQHDDRWDWMIIDPESGRLVGEVVLNEFDPDNRNANIRIGLNLGLNINGKGYGTEALRLAVDFGFNQLNLHRISLGVYAFNDRAIHVYEKLGFRREGVLRDVLFDGTSYHDEIVMSRLSTD